MWVGVQAEGVDPSLVSSLSFHRASSALHWHVGGLQVGLRGCCVSLGAGLTTPVRRPGGHGWGEEEESPLLPSGNLGLGQGMGGRRAVHRQHIGAAAQAWKGAQIPRALGLSERWGVALSGGLLEQEKCWDPQEGSKETDFQEIHPFRWREWVSPMWIGHPFKRGLNWLREHGRWGEAGRLQCHREQPGGQQGESRGEGGARVTTGKGFSATALGTSLSPAWSVISVGAGTWTTAPPTGGSSKGPLSSPLGSVPGTSVLCFIQPASVAPPPAQGAIHSRKHDSRLAFRTAGS